MTEKKNQPMAKQAKKPKKAKKLAGKKELSKAQTLMGIKNLRLYF